MDRLAKILGVGAGMLLAVGLWLGLVQAPPDAVQGEVQRIMYVHVPSILTAYLAFTVVLVASIAYLLRGTRGWDRLAHASAEVGVVFTAVTLVTGSIWGKPIWGVWWTWDARLTGTAVLFLVYVGYLMLRSVVDDRDRAGRYAAVVGILGFFDIIFTHMAVKWFRTLHQPSTLERGSISMVLLVPLMVNLGAFVLLYAYFLMRRVRLAALEEAVEAEVLGG
ncbi:MAG: cytochrome c biogenesis protein CcsA [candidate division NC10 bacterium]|jgi:heme exporter protein C